MAQIDAAPIKSAIFTMVAVLTATVITTNAREKTETVTLSIPTVDISSERDRHTVINGRIKYEPGPRHQSTVSTRFNLPEIDRRIEAKVSALPFLSVA